MNLSELKDKIKAGFPIHGQTFDEDVRIDFSGSDIPSQLGTAIIFDSCHFNGILHLSNLRGEGQFILRNCDFKESTRHLITNFEIFRISFEDCMFANITLAKTTIEDFFVTNCYSHENIYLYALKAKTARLNWENDDSRRVSFEIDCPELDAIIVHSRNSIKNFKIYDSKRIEIFGGIRTASFHSKVISRISLESYFPNRRNNPHLKYNSFGEIIFSYNSISEALAINDLSVERLVMDNIESSSGLVRFNELELEGASFFDVTIKSFYWNQIKFDDFLKIERCDFSNLKLSNIKWLKGKKMSGSFIDDRIKPLYSITKRFYPKSSAYSKEDLIQLQYEREVYRQLKAASSANQNHIEALDFYKNEMRLFWREIRINGGVSVWDRILVFLNRWVSDFGQSWALPLFWLFMFHTLIYFCIVGFNFTNDFDAFRMGTEQYFELLNPVHKTPDYIKGFDVGLELLLRILDGFFIYHFLRATRKFGKI